MNHVVSPDNSDQSIERQIQAKGLNAPRVKPSDVAENIVDEYYFTGRDGIRGATDKLVNGDPVLGLITFCVLVLRNGFTVTGQSACASAENFDADIGRKVARENAVQQIWPLMGYCLKEQLHQAVKIDIAENGDYLAG